MAQALFWRQVQHDPSTIEMEDDGRVHTGGYFGDIRLCRLRALPSMLGVVKEVKAGDGEDYRRECETLSLFHHPRIVRFLGTVEISGLWVTRGLVMQRADGDLKDYLQVTTGNVAHASPKAVWFNSLAVIPC